MMVLKSAHLFTHDVRDPDRYTNLNARDADVIAMMILKSAHLFVHDAWNMNSSRTLMGPTT